MLFRMVLTILTGKMANRLGSLQANGLLLVQNDAAQVWNGRFQL